MHWYFIRRREEGEGTTVLLLITPRLPKTQLIVGTRSYLDVWMIHNGTRDKSFSRIWVAVRLVWSVQEQVVRVSGRGVRKVLPVADAHSQRDKRDSTPKSNYLILHIGHSHREICLIERAPAADDTTNLLLKCNMAAIITRNDDK